MEMDHTTSSKLGFQPVTVPAVSTAAALLRASAPTWVKYPPRYTVLPERATVFTCDPVTLGFQLVTVPAVSTAAALLRVCAPTWVKVPPMYKVLPDMAIEYTSPEETFGFQAVSAPVER